MGKILLPVSGASFGSTLEESNGVIRSKLGGVTSVTFKPSGTEGETLFPNANNARITNPVVGDWNFYIGGRTNPCGCRNRANYIEFFNGNQAGVGVAYGSRLDNVSWTTRCKFKYVTGATLCNGLLAVFDSTQAKGFWLHTDVSKRLQVYVLGNNSPYLWQAIDAVNILVPNTTYYMELVHNYSTLTLTGTAYSSVVDETAWLAGGSSGTPFATCSVVHNMGAISGVNKIGFGWVQAADGFQANERQAVYFNGFLFKVFDSTSPIATLVQQYPGIGDLDLSSFEANVFLDGAKQLDSVDFAKFAYSNDGGGSYSSFKKPADIKTSGIVPITTGIIWRTQFNGAQNQQISVADGCMGSMGAVAGVQLGAFESSAWR